MGGAWPRRVGVSLLAAALLFPLALGAAAQAAPLAKRCAVTLRAHGLRRLLLGDSRCMRVSVPLDRSGAVRRHAPAARPDPAARVRDGERARSSRSPAALGRRPPRCSTTFATRARRFGAALPAAGDVRPARHGRLGPAELPELDDVPFDRADTRHAGQRAVAACAARLGPARAHYATTDSVAGRRGGAHRARRRRPRPLRDFVRDQGRARLRGRISAARQQAAARLGRATRGRRPVRCADDRGDPAPRCSADCARGACPFTRDAGADLGALGSCSPAGPLRGRSIDGHGASAPRRGHCQAICYPLLVIGDLVAAAARARPGCRACRAQRRPGVAAAARDDPLRELRHRRSADSERCCLRHAARTAPAVVARHADRRSARRRSARRSPRFRRPACAVPCRRVRAFGFAGPLRRAGPRRRSRSRSCRCPTSRR